jgi:pimeloyl-ACP methyl ester carboxylesterase
MPKLRRQQPRLDPNRGNRPPEMVEMVEPAWILMALGGMFGFAILCVYATLCVMFSRGQWQFVLHPSRTVAATPESVGLKFDAIRFGVDASGEPQLDGWWIPSGIISDPTVILLHSGDGSMADALPQARALHDASLNVLLFDYRGFGQSGGQHPTQSMMQDDAESALNYLISTRHAHPGGVVVYGTGVGASLAVRLCASHAQLPALILESADGDFGSRVRADVRARFVPVRLLFHDSFPLADPLHRLATPKLLISYTKGLPPTELERAADPKTTVELPPGDNAALHHALTRFLGTYIAQPPPTLTPHP